MQVRPGLGWLTVAAERTAFRLRCVPGRAGASKSGSGSPAGTPARFGGNRRQRRAGSPARGLRGRSAQRVALCSRPSRGNLLLEEWAGGGDGGQPSLASARASRRPFHPRDAPRRSPSLTASIKKRKKERKITPQPSPVTGGPRGFSCGFRERTRGPAGRRRRRRRRRRRPTWRRAGLGRAAAAPEPSTAVARLGAPTPAPTLARRPRSAQRRSAGALPGAGTARRQRRAARQAPDPQLRSPPAGAARRPEPWNRRRSST